MVGFSSTAALPYFPLSLVVLMIIILWFAAISDIGSHARGGAFTAGQLAYMAVAVSIAAVMAILAASAILPTGPTDVSRAATAGAATGCDDAKGTFLFSFGIEQPAYASSGCAENRTGKHISGTPTDAP